MPKNGSSAGTRRQKTSFMFSSLHDAVLAEVASSINPPPWFRHTNNDKGSMDEYQTHVMGKFQCTNGRCARHGWGSKKIAILIRRYPDNGYNALVFNQRCKTCNQLGVLTLDEKSYIERVAYRVQKWAGVALPAQEYKEKKGDPHRTELCEGCRRGVCRQSAARGY